MKPNPDSAAYQEGMDAFKASLDMAYQSPPCGPVVCPYIAGTQEHIDWNYGYGTAEDRWLEYD